MILKKDNGVLLLPPYSELYTISRREDGNCRYFIARVGYDEIIKLRSAHPTMRGRPIYAALVGQELHLYPNADMDITINIRYAPAVVEI